MIIVIKKRKKEKIVKFFPKIGKNFGPGFQAEAWKSWSIRTIYVILKQHLVVL